MLEGLNTTLNTKLAKFSFGAGIRIDFYRSLLMLIDNNVRLNVALKELYTVYSEGGKKKNHPVAIIIQSCLNGMNNGHSFTESIKEWVPQDEAMLLQAGELAGSLSNAFREVEFVMTAKKKIFGAVMGAVSYPVVLFGMLGFLLHMISTDLVPKLAKVVSPEKWNGTAGVLRDIAWFVNNYGLTSIIGVVVTVVLCLVSLPYLRGPFRVYLDKVAPWSIYRMIQGASFLLNVSALIKSGMRLNQVLEMLAEQAKPWLRQRIEATSEGLSEGRNFGESLSQTGYHFPDIKANRFISVIANYSGLDVALSKFGSRWLDETVNTVQKFSKLMLVMGVMSVGIVMLLVIAGAGSLQDIIQSSIK
jgi:type II secretory pathway component PulF